MIDVTDVLPWDDVCFIDCETRSAADQENSNWESVRTTSTRRYAKGAWPIVITWGYGLDGEIHRWESPDVTRPPKTEDIPKELRTWTGYLAAHNSAFDRAILDRYLGHGVEGWIDMMAHCAYNNLPLGLDMASKACGYSGKIAQGKGLIKIFCPPDGALPSDRPDDWAKFLEYADVDILMMQNIAASTLPVPYDIWQEFWASEFINDRGMPLDLDMIKGGAMLAEAYSEQVNDRVKEITHGDLYSVRQYVAQRAWVWDRVKDDPNLAINMIEAQREKPDGDGEIEYILKMDRPRITKLIAALLTKDEKVGLTDDEDAVLQFLEEREFGASAAPAKFIKMVDMVMPNGRLPNQYVFSGATQTGRYSSKGVQVHNMTRSTVGSVQDENGAAMFLADTPTHDTPIDVRLEHFEAAFGNGGKALSRLIRPAIVAELDHMCVWSDWSNIEARALPWLAMAEDRLDIFRAIDADPDNEPDIYIQAAAGMYHEDKYELFKGHLAKDAHAKGQRQKGKIAELALGFSGGPGALQSMAANYGMQFEADEAAEIVDRWRTANAWAVKFWDKVWGCFQAAAANPGENYPAGRVTFQGQMVGNEVWVFAFLPDGRPLVYRNVREKTDKIYDPFEPDVLVEVKKKLAFDGSDGFKFLWRGIVVENITQAICASILRRALVTLETTPDYAYMPVIGHTHDEIVTMPREADVAQAKQDLAGVMLDKADWMDGFPIGVDVLVNEWYSKAVE